MTSTINEELKIMPLAAKLCRKRRWAIDGGANSGEFTQEMLKYFEFVCAVEPVQSTVAELRLRYADNDRVMIHSEALWHTSNVILHMAHPEKRTKTTAYYATTKEKHSEHEVTTTTIDDLLRSNVDFIKLDVEGAELNALMGATRTIETYKPVILVECINKQLNRYDHDIDALDSWLVKRGYRLRKEDGPNRLYA